MSSLDEKLAVISDIKIRSVLHRLHTEAGHETWKLIWHYLPYMPAMFSGRKLPWDRLERTHDKDYLASPPDGCMYSYLLARAINARRIVEFGTSFGVSTIYLAMAVRDNGGGIVFGTEMIPAKAAKARSNIAEAGLAEYVEVREGNAVDSLRDIEGPIDFMLSDGYPRYALPVLQLVAPKMRRGSIIINHNAASMKGDHVDYVAYLQEPSNGFISSNILLMGELSVRVAE